MEKNLTKKNGERAKKSLGQNFLKSKRIVGNIARAGQLNERDAVLEVGPGKGILTEALLNAVLKVTAVEKDDRLFEMLKEKFAPELKKGKLELIHGDILELDIKKLGLNAGEYKLIANIPYYITGQIFRKFLSSENYPSMIVLLVQKEVAGRIIARDGKESLLSLSVKAYGRPIYVKTIEAEYFSPKPKVDSAILKIEDISKKKFGDLSEENFFKILKAGFAFKRKYLIRNLEKVPEKKNLQKIFDECGISTKARAENLPLEIWKKLAEAVSTSWNREIV